MNRRLLHPALALFLLPAATLSQQPPPATFEISFPASIHDQPITGRVYVMITRDGDREPRLQLSQVDGIPFFGRDIDQLAPGETVVIDQTDLGFPVNSLGDIPDGDYFVQAFVNIYTRYPRADGHVVWMHEDRWEGQRWWISPGNLHSEVQRLRLDSSRGYRIQLVLDRLAEYNRRMAEDRKDGGEPTLYFILIGHGQIAPDGAGYVSDLFHGVIAPSKASFNHVIIDACTPGATVAREQYFSSADLERYPNTGVILSTSRQQETHEWMVYRGGVFSHQVLSGLVGAADVNSDGRVEYSEMSAFIAAANAKVSDARARLEVFSRPPALDERRPIFVTEAEHFSSRLVVPPSVSGHLFLEDDRGIRYADFHKASGASMTLALVGASYFHLKDDLREARIPADGRRYVLTASQWRPVQLAARGSLDESFRKDLFAVPYDWSFYHGFVASHGGLPVLDPTPVQQAVVLSEDEPALYERWWFWTGVGTILAGAAVTGVMLTDGDRPPELPVPPR